jgi:hypothetical protein
MLRCRKILLIRLAVVAVYTAMLARQNLPPRQRLRLCDIGERLNKA